MKTAGFLVFVVGIITAITSGAKLPASALAQDGEARTSVETASQFPDTVGPFAGGVVICGIGLGLWWSAVRQERVAARVARAAGHMGEESNPVALLDQLQQNLSATLDELDSLVESDMIHRIDALIDSHVTPLAEARHHVIDQFGMSHGSEILVATAYGERMLNRVWSAAADGYLEEARASFREAAAAYSEAADMMSPAGDTT